jgi:aspartate/methionine/tyrosine aminotransferase
MYTPAPRNAEIAPFQVMEIATRARALAAGGKSVIHMEIGEPDFPTPAPVIAAAKAFLDQGGVYYTSALGIPALRAGIAQHYQRLCGVTVDPSRIIVTAGGSAALLLVNALIVGRDDEILMTDPSYPCNRHFARVLEGRAVTIATGHETAYQFSAAQIDAAWTPRTRGALLASPSNPTGTMVPAGEGARIAATVLGRGGVFISDETYLGLTYGRKVETALAFTKPTDEAYVIGSFSKYFNMTGWRLGWLVAPPHAVRDIEKLAQNLYISPSGVAQHAALACFTDETYAIADSRVKEFNLRRRYLTDALRAIGFKIPIDPDGGFFVYVDCSVFSKDSAQFCIDVLDATGVAFSPGTDFGIYRANEHVRIAYAVGMEKLQEGVARLTRFLPEYLRRSI